MMTPQDAWERLLVGNRRYAAVQQIYPRQTMYHRQMLLDGQTPIAAILSCSDSRVPAELIFDQGLGDLFIVRTAGHAVDELVLASLEYAVFALRVPLIVIMGHAYCGALTAVVKGDALPGHLPHLAQHLEPALASVDRQAHDAVDQAIHANSCFTMRQLCEKSQILRDAHDKGDLALVAAYYDLNTGHVEILEWF